MEESMVVRENEGACNAFNGGTGGHPIRSGRANGFNASTEERKALKVGPAGIEIAYQREGHEDAPVVLLIMGGAAQLIHWPDAFCNALLDRGLQVIRFDNRDAGHSTHMTDAPSPDLRAV